MNKNQHISFEEQFNKDQEKHNIQSGSSDFFNIKEGNNKMRILAEPKLIVERFKYGICYKGAEYCQKEALERDNARLQYRYLTWIIDRLDGRIKLFKIPYTITKTLVGLKMAMDEGYGFENFPMPYDVNIKAKNAGSKQVEYSVLPSKKESPIEKHEQTEFEKQTEISDIIERMKQKQMEKMGVAQKDEKPGQTLDEIEYPEDPEEVTAF